MIQTAHYFLTFLVTTFYQPKKCRPFKAGDFAYPRAHPDRHWRAATPSDFVIPSDFAIPSDYAIPSDLAIPSDFVIPSDFATPSDLDIPSDVVIPSDFAIPSDFVIPNDCVLRARRRIWLGNGVNGLIFREQSEGSRYRAPRVSGFAQRERSLFPTSPLSR